MDKLLELASKLREHINKPRLQNVLMKDSDGWNMLCVSLDAFDYTSRALNNYISSSSFDGVADLSYVIVAGTLQSLFVQQDSITEVCSVLDYECNIKDDLKQIRDIRNNSIGHPVRKKSGKYKSANFLAILSPHKIMLMRYEANRVGPITEDIDIPVVVKKQQETLINILNGLLSELEEREKKHKEEFMSTRLCEYFNGQSYLISKLYEFALGSYPLEMTQINFSQIKESVNQTIEELKRRDLYEGMEYIFEELEYPMDKVEKCLRDGSNIDKKDLNIYIFFIANKIKELLEILGEIDEEYSNDSEE